LIFFHHLTIDLLKIERFIWGYYGLMTRVTNLKG
jgi:hypothetical protein